MKVIKGKPFFSGIHLRDNKSLSCGQKAETMPLPQEVYISLSEKGRAAYEHHAAFHQEMIQSIAEQLTKGELDALTKALTCLNQWFREKEKIRRNE